MPAEARQRQPAWTRAHAHTAILGHFRSMAHTCWQEHFRPFWNAIGGGALLPFDGLLYFNGAIISREAQIPGLTSWQTSTRILTPSCRKLCCSLGRWRWPARSPAPPPRNYPACSAPPPCAHVTGRALKTIWTRRTSPKARPTDQSAASELPLSFVTPSIKWIAAEKHRKAFHPDTRGPNGGALTCCSSRRRSACRGRWLWNKTPRRRRSSPPSSDRYLRSLRESPSTSERTPRGGERAAALPYRPS